MKDPAFLTLDEALALHFDQIDRYGGLHGVRDLGLLESALAMPRATFGNEFLHATIEEMAAASLFHLVKNDPFLDGNKRTGLAVTIAFLGLNDFHLLATEDEVVSLIIAIAEGRTEKPDIALFIRSHFERMEF